jgi:hypothetical protein
VGTVTYRITQPVSVIPQAKVAAEIDLCRDAGTGSSMLRIGQITVVLLREARLST